MHNEVLGGPGDLRGSAPVIAGQDWVDGRQAARFLGLRADHGQEAHQVGEVFPLEGGCCALAGVNRLD